MTTPRTHIRTTHNVGRGNSNSNSSGSIRSTVVVPNDATSKSMNRSATANMAPNATAVMDANAVVYKDEPTAIRLFISGFPGISATQLQQQIEKRFQRFGEIRNVEINAKGFGFMTIVGKPSAVEAAIKIYRNTQWHGKFRIEYATMHYLERLKQTKEKEIEDRSAFVQLLSTPAVEWKPTKRYHNLEGTEFKNVENYEYDEFGDDYNPPVVRRPVTVRSTSSSSKPTQFAVAKELPEEFASDSESSDSDADIFTRLHAFEADDVDLDAEYAELEGESHHEVTVPSGPAVTSKLPKKEIKTPPETHQDASDSDMEFEVESDRNAQFSHGLALNTHAKPTNKPTRTISKAEIDDLTKEIPKKSMGDWLGDDGDDEEIQLVKEDEVGIKKVFEGTKGSSLLKLQRSFHGDERFKLDARFADDSESSDDESDIPDGARKNTNSSGSENLVIDGTQNENKAGDTEEQLRKQLRAEALASLNLLDEIVPTGNKFAFTIPKYAVPDSEQLKAVGIDVEDVKQNITLWRDVKRFDPDTMGESVDVPPRKDLTTAKSQLKVSKPDATSKKRKMANVDDIPSTASLFNYFPSNNSVDMEEGEILAQYEDEPRDPNDPKWKILVPRLRTLITEPEATVSFSFSILPDGSDTNIVQPQASKSFAIDDDSAPQPLYKSPKMDAMDGIDASTLIPKSSTSNSLMGSALAADRTEELPKGTISSVINSLVKESSSKPSHLLNQAPQNNANKPRSAQLDNSDSEDDMAVASAFMRTTTVENVEKQWLNNRQQVVQEYKKKSKEAVRKERQKDNQRMAKKARSFAR